MTPEQKLFVEEVVRTLRNLVYDAEAKYRPGVESGAYSESATCTRCGISAMGHDMLVGP